MRYLLVACILLTQSISYSQKTIATISGQLSFPQGEYKETYPVTGAGIRINVMHRPDLNLPLSVGAEIGYLVTASDNRYFDIYYLGFYDRYQVTASNNVFTLAFKLRADLVPHDKPVQVFIDGTVGTNLFFSSVETERDTYFGNTQYAGGNSTKGYWALLFGPGMGIEIPVGENKESAISLKASYFLGSSTKYLTDPYIDNNGNVFFNERESKTNMLMIEAGIRIGVFGKKKRNR